MAQAVENPPAMQEKPETWVQSLGWEDPLEEEMATHSQIFLPRKFLVGYSPQSCKELDTTKHTCMHADRFWIILFSFVFFFFFSICLIFSVIHWLLGRIMVDLHMFVFLLFFFKLVLCFHSVVIRKDTWYDVSFIGFTETCFVSKCDTILENIPSAHIFWCFWMECSIGVYEVCLV